MSARTGLSLLSSKSTLSALRKEAAHCHGCELFQTATQTVFGEGKRTASFVLVGEQPGEQEDRIGRPFVGPSGKVLHQALQDAGISEVEIYLTNAVKHFRWKKKGKRKIHQSPLSHHVKACRPWLTAELEQIHPEVILCLGVTATYAILGIRTKLDSLRHQVLFAKEGIKTIVTVHPSSLLRIPEAVARHRAYQRFVDDLRFARQVIEKQKAS